MIFVGVDAYEAAGVLLSARDLFEQDDGALTRHELTCFPLSSGGPAIRKIADLGAGARCTQSARDRPNLGSWASGSRSMRHMATCEMLAFPLII
jgi:hypothetical protein